jgi:hypothetical protein
MVKRIFMVRPISGKMAKLVTRGPTVLGDEEVMTPSRDYPRLILHLEAGKGSPFGFPDNHSTPNQQVPVDVTAVTS